MRASRMPGDIDFTKGEFTLRFVSEGELYEWMGSTFRGAMGRSIKGIICQDTETDCHSCKRNETCLYFHLYERKEANRGHSPPQRPAILIPPYLGNRRDRIVDRDTELKLGFLTFGKFSKYIPHLILSLQTMGRFGIGDARHIGKNRFEVVEGRVSWEEEPFFKDDCLNLSNFSSRSLKDIKPINSDRIRVKFITPFGGKQLPLTMGRYLFYTKLRIVRSVNEYGNGGYVPGEYKPWEKVVGRPAIVRRKIFRRRSSRSDKDRFEAYLGEIDFDISSLGETERWLLGASEIFGLGPNSSFGMGFVKITDLD